MDVTFCDNPNYPIQVLNDAGAKPFINGSAFHLYGGNIDALTTVKTAHPDKELYFTEQYTSSTGGFAGDFRWHVRVARQTFRADHGERDKMSDPGGGSGGQKITGRGLEEAQHGARLPRRSIGHIDDYLRGFKSLGQSLAANGINA